jgi:hypothetical protein
MILTGDEAVQRILELSADLQIKRRATMKYSLEYHDYSVAIAAYGKVLETLTMPVAPCKRSFASIGFLESLTASLEPRAAF